MDTQIIKDMIREHIVCSWKVPQEFRSECLIKKSNKYESHRTI